MTDSLKSLLAYRIIGGTIAAAIMLLLVWLFPGMTRHDAQYVGAAIVVLMCVCLLLPRLWLGWSALTQVSPGVRNVRITGGHVSIRPRLPR